MAVPDHRRDAESAAELTAGLLVARWRDNELAAGQTAVLALLTCWLDEESATRRMAVLACWVNDKLAVGLMAVLACWRDFESASGLMAVLAHRRDVKSAVELTAVLTRWLLVRQQVGGGVDGIA